MDPFRTVSPCGNACTCTSLLCSAQLCGLQKYIHSTAQTRLTFMITASSFSNRRSFSNTAFRRSSSASLSCSTRPLMRSCCSSSLVPMPGSPEIRISICCSLRIKSRASSRWSRWNCSGEGIGGPEGAASAGSLCASGCCGGESFCWSAPSVGSDTPACSGPVVAVGGSSAGGEWFVWIYLMHA